MIEYRCHVCGWLLEGPPWGEEGIYPSDDICPCCGCHFGYDDARASGVKKLREAWLSSGGKWFNPNKKPSNWSLKDQMERIPSEIPKGIDRNLDQ